MKQFRRNRTSLRVYLHGWLESNMKSRFLAALNVKRHEAERFSYYEKSSTSWNGCHSNMPCISHIYKVIQLQRNIIFLVSSWIVVKFYAHFNHRATPTTLIYLQQRNIVSCLHLITFKMVCWHVLCIYTVCVLTHDRLEEYILTSKRPNLQDSGNIWNLSECDVSLCLLR